MNRISLKVSFIYLIIGSSWIVLSDKLVESILKYDPSLINIVQTGKGIFFIVVTSIILYLLINYFTKKLENEKENYKNLFENIPVPMLVIDPENLSFLDINKTAVEQYGYSKDEFMSMTIKDIRPEEYIPKLIKDVQESKVDSRKNIGYWVHKTKSGSLIDVEIIASPIHHYGKKSRLIMSNNISDRKKVEDHLLFQANILDNVQDCVIVTDLDGNVIYWNRGAKEIFEYDESEILGKKTIILYFEENYDFDTYKKSLESIANGNDVNTEWKGKTKSGRMVWVYIKTTALKDWKGNAIGFVGVSKDITERKIEQEQLKASLKEKEIMLKEIHHRVKNNLQLITSLLSLQSSFNNEEVKKLLSEAQNRIKSMAIIHDILYEKKNFSEINFSDYINKFLNHLISTYRNTSQVINYKLEMDKINLNLDLAIPCGLIINELVSNSLKHAFAETYNCLISVSLKEKSNNILELNVQDNGKGIPENINLYELNSLGLQLVDSLIEQIEGTYQISNNNGTNFQIQFKNQ